MSTLDTAAGVEAELGRVEAEYEQARKDLLVGWQTHRKHLRALLAVLQDREAANEPEDTKE